jgi:hypothetical protein
MNDPVDEFAISLRQCAKFFVLMDVTGRNRPVVAGKVFLAMNVNSNNRIERGPEIVFILVVQTSLYLLRWMST